MQLRHRRPETPEINLTPLIDVVFLLLIFFMVSTTFERESELAIELPEATAEPDEDRPESVEVSIDAEGRFYVDGRPLVNTRPETLRQALADAMPDGDAPPLVVSADARTPHQAVVAVMDAARRLGIVRLSFSARLVEDDE